MALAWMHGCLCSWMAALLGCARVTFWVYRQSFDKTSLLHESVADRMYPGTRPLPNLTIGMDAESQLVSSPYLVLY